MKRRDALKTIAAGSAALSLPVIAQAQTTEQEDWDWEKYLSSPRPSVALTIDNNRAWNFLFRDEVKKETTTPLHPNVRNATRHLFKFENYEIDIIVNGVVVSIINPFCAYTFIADSTPKNFNAFFVIKDRVLPAKESLVSQSHFFNDLFRVEIAKIIGGLHETT